MRITPSGNVGINNTAPIHTLSVNGNTFIGNNLTVNGSLVVTGNVTLSGTTTYVNSTIITTNDLNFILANNAASNTLANGAGIIVGTSANLVYNSTATSWQSNVSFIPSTNNLNLGSATQLWNFYGNNGFYTGTVNSTSHTIGTAFIANSIGVFVGNSTVNTQIGANSSAFASIQVFSSFNSFSQISIQNSNTGASASADHVAYNNDGSFNTFVDTGINSSNWSNTLWTINGANDAYLFSSNSNLSVGTNATSGYLNFFVGGTLATNEGMRLSNTGVNIGNANTTLAKLSVGNSSVNTITNSSSISIGAIGATNGAFVNTTTITIGNSTINTFSNSTHFFSGNSTVYGLGNNTSEALVSPTGNLVLNSTSLTLSNATVTVTTANLSGIYTNGAVNAASYTVGTNFVANTTGVYTTGIVNAASHTVGTAVVANATGVYTTGTVNTATFTAATSANVGANIQITTSAITVGNSSLAASVSVSVSNNTSNVQITPANITVANSTVSSVLGNGTISVVNATVTSNTLTLGTSNASGHTTYGSAGYTYLPNGLKMMWGAITTANSTANIISFSAQTGFAFTTNCFSLTVTSNAVASVPAAYTVNATNFTLITNSVTASTVSFMAIGI